MKPRLPNDAGAAMLEFVLVLPFLWLILMLVINFGHAHLERHRALVAAREMGLRYGGEFAGGRDDMAAVIARIEQDTLSVRGLKGIMSGPDSGGCARNAGSASAGEIDDAFSSAGNSTFGKAISSFLSKMSQTQVYSVSLEGPQVGGLLPNAGHTACFAIDGQTWTHAETGGASGLLKSLLGTIGGPVGEFLGSLF